MLEYLIESLSGVYPGQVSAPQDVVFFFACVWGIVVPILGNLGPGQSGLGQSGPGQSGPWTVGPQTLWLR